MLVLMILYVVTNRNHDEHNTEIVMRRVVFEELVVTQVDKEWNPKGTRKTELRM